MAQQKSSKKVKRSTGNRKAATPKAGPRSGANYKRRRGQTGLYQGATLIDGIADDRQAQERQDNVIRAMMAPGVAGLPEGSVEALAALTWFTTFVEMSPTQGHFQKVTDAAYSEMKVDAMSDLDQRRARFGFGAARAAMKQVLFGEPATITA